MNGSSLVEYKGKYFDKQIMLTDPDFLKIFSFPLIKGSAETALKDLSSIIISRKHGKSCFWQ